jgi:hypothetical protein
MHHSWFILLWSDCCINNVIGDSGILGFIQYRKLPHFKTALYPHKNLDLLVTPPQLGGVDAPKLCSERRLPTPAPTKEPVTNRKGRRTGAWLETVDCLLTAHSRIAKSQLTWSIAVAGLRRCTTLEKWFYAKSD